MSVYRKVCSDWIDAEGEKKVEMGEKKFDLNGLFFRNHHMTPI